MSLTFTNSVRRGSNYVISALALLFLFQAQGVTQTLDVVKYDGKDVFLSGINVAWVNYSADLGPNAPSLSDFRTIFQKVRNSGGNALRLWLYTTGANAPTYNSQGYVSGPGPVAIQNLREILSLAHQYRVGLILCLWSFDMLGKHEGLDSTLLYDNEKMLTDTSYTMAFVRNALTPLVDSVKTSPAIIAWEVCNEPNGMVTGMEYYTQDPTVPMSAIQQFTNLIAGGIHRADPGALVTIGAGSFSILTDVNMPAATRKSELETISSMSPGELQAMTENFNVAHRLNLTTEEMQNYLERVASLPDSNYFSDRNLIAAGGDSLGTLDFYCDHYYGGGSLSPFTHNFSYWQLDKPVAVAEFYMQNTDGVVATSLLQTLYQNGYAGALVWSWTDFPKTPNNPNNAASDTWASLQQMWNSYRQAVDVFGADWPLVSIVNPVNNGLYPDSTQMTLTAAVVDTSDTVSLVKFYGADSLLASVTVPSDTSTDTLFYTYEWKNLAPGNYSVTAVAENRQGQTDSSAAVSFSLGTPPMTYLPANKAVTNNSSIALKSDGTVQGGSYFDIETNDSNATVTWTFDNIASAGVYPISFGYELHYQSPKTQFVNVNGARVDTVVFQGSTSAWQSETISVPLVQGTNTVQMQISWGWMYLSYLGVPTEVITPVLQEPIVATSYSLSQNYPNPFNPTTKIEFSLPSEQRVSLVVYDVLGQKVQVLLNQKMSPGTHMVNFNGASLASGVYFYRLVAGSYVKTMKMLLLK